MIHLYSNENFPLPVVEELRKLGYNVLTIQETGKSGQSYSDQDVLNYAISKKRTVLTLNRKHFIRLHRSQPIHSGIIVCTFDPDFSGQAQRIHKIIKLSKTLINKLLRVNRPKK